MTGMNDGWEKCYGVGYTKLSPSEQQSVNKLHEAEMTRNHLALEEEMDNYEDDWMD